MIADARRQTYRPRRQTGLATMRDLWHFAQWLGDRLNQDIQIEGVTRVRDTSAGVFIAAPGGSDTASITPQRGRYRFPRTRGLARRADLDNYARWLESQIKDQIASNDISGRATASGGTVEFP